MTSRGARTRLDGVRSSAKVWPGPRRPARAVGERAQPDAIERSLRQPPRRMMSSRVALIMLTCEARRAVPMRTQKLSARCGCCDLSLWRRQTHEVILAHCLSSPSLRYGACYSLGLQQHNAVNDHPSFTVPLCRAPLLASHACCASYGRPSPMPPLPSTPLPSPPLPPVCHLSSTNKI